MAYPTSVNNQITDAVTQSNVKVIGEAPALALGTLFQALSHSTGVLFENSVAAQQQQNTLSQAAANMGVMQVYALDTATGAGAAEKAGQIGLPDVISGLLTVLEAFKPRKPQGL
jgi:hypothetical protein